MEARRSARRSARSVPKRVRPRKKKPTLATSRMRRMMTAGPLSAAEQHLHPIGSMKLVLKNKFGFPSASYKLMATHF